MKQEILERLEREIKACKKYAESSIKNTKEGKIKSAINFLDIANTAKKCADQAHEQFWKATQGKLNAEELELFVESETLYQDINKAYRELQILKNELLSI